MNVERIIRIMAGVMVLVSLSLGVEASPIYHNINWLWFTGFIGLNLLQSGFTGFCPPEVVLRKLGVKHAGQ